jgi:hypothetical protein
MKEEKKVTGVKLEGKWFYTREELRVKYEASDSFIWKRIQDNNIEERMVLGHKVYRDNPDIFTKKIPGKIGPEHLPKTGTYPEMYQKVERIEAGNKDIFFKILELEKEIAAVKDLLQQLVDINTKPSSPASTPSV